MTAGCGYSWTEVGWIEKTSKYRGGSLA